MTTTDELNAEAANAAAEPAVSSELPFRAERLGDGNLYLIFAPADEAFDANVHRSTFIPAALAPDVLAVWDAYQLELAETTRLRSEWERTCKLVAEMHAAAVGEVTGPRLGVVEDVAAVRAERDAFQAENERLLGELTEPAGETTA